MSEDRNSTEREEYLEDASNAERPRNLAVNPINIGLATADGVLSPNNSRIVQRLERSANSSAQTRAKNDPVECNYSEEVPENFFGNYNSFRRPVLNRPAVYHSAQELEKSGNDSSSLTGESACLYEQTVGDSEPTTDEILEAGLGLVLHPQSPKDGAVENTFTYSSSHVHNWQSGKHCVKSRLQYLLNTGVLSDVTFLVGGSSLLMSNSTSVLPTPERFVAHKFVLSMSSAVFDAMFNGRMASLDESAIEIPDVEPMAFTALLKFVYTDEVDIESESVMAVLYAAKKYAIQALEQQCVEFLKDNIHSENVFMLLTQARLFDESVLAKMCLDNIDKNTCEAMSSDGFVDIDLDTLCLVLERDSLNIRESKLFSAVTKWAEHACIKQEFEITAQNLRTVLGRAVMLIRYPLMTVEEFAVQVAQSKILTDSELVELFLYFTITPKPPITFTDLPRCCLKGKEQVVSRFCQVDHRWGYSGTSDRIKFLVNRRIYVAGFGIYGSVHGPAEYAATIEILSADTQRVLGSTDTTFHCDGSSSTFRVMFKDAVEISPFVHYIAAVTLKGPDSFYGGKGLRKVTHESPTSGKVSFQFSYAAGNNNGTSVEDGQIPEIMFYTCNDEHLS